MVIDQDFLSLNDVIPKLIDILFDLYKAGIPSPPLMLKAEADESNEYIPVLNEFYALKVLLKQGKTPSATSVHKLIGGKTDRVFQNVKWLKSSLPEEFQALPVDPTAAPMEIVKRELIKVESALFKAELAEQERYAGEQLTKQADDYEKRIRELELKASELAGKNGVLEGLSKDHQRTIDHLHERLKEEAINERELHNAQLLAVERKQALNDKSGVIASLKEQFDHYVVEAGKRADQLKNDKGRSESREEVLRRELQQQTVFIKGYHEEREGLLARVADLSAQVEQDALTLKHEHDQASLIVAIHESLKPLDDLKRITELASNIAKKEGVNMKAVTKALSDVSTKMLNLTSRLEKKAK